jgi:uncharacterized SAM-binding protein YcdF (DUF218 family)
MVRINSRSTQSTQKTIDDAYVSSAPSVKNPQIGRVSSSLRLPRLVERKERWGLSWLGWVVVVSVMLTVGYVVLLHAHPFLSVTDRTEANILVIEGWVHPYAIRAGVDEFKTGRYQRIFTTGGPVTGSGSYTSDSRTSASVGASGLKAAGVPSEFIQMVPSRVNDRDRTYSSAVALRRWLRDHDAQVKGVNVVTENTHARRSWFLFQKAFGDTATVGIIAIQNPDYDPKHWWRYSEGVKDVLGEAIAYMYARFFFYPAEPLHVNEGNNRRGP